MSSAIQYEDDREEQWDDTDDEFAGAARSSSPAALQPLFRCAARRDHLRDRVLRGDPGREKSVSRLERH